VHSNFCWNRGLPDNHKNTRHTIWWETYARHGAPNARPALNAGVSLVFHSARLKPNKLNTWWFYSRSSWQRTPAITRAHVRTGRTSRARMRSPRATNSSVRTGLSYCAPPRLLPTVFSWPSLHFPNKPASTHAQRAGLNLDQMQTRPRTHASSYTLQTPTHARHSDEHMTWCILTNSSETTAPLHILTYRAPAPS
jgi:hypothetical protein